jgi:mono/diheme cytochrome c family protein
MRRALLFPSLAVVLSCSDSKVAGPVDAGGPGDGGALVDGGVLADGGADGGFACPAGVTRVAVTPPSVTLTLGNGPLPEQRFTAQGELGDGGFVPITVSWSVSRADDGPPGTIDADGLYRPDPNAGGIVTVRADGSGCTGTATVEIRIDREIVTPEAPADAAGSFSGSPATDASRTPSVVYPSHETRLPRNVFNLLFQWRKAGSDLFRLEFTGIRGRVRVYTGGAHELCSAAAPPAGCWQAPSDLWSWIASSHAGEEVLLRVGGALRAQPGAWYESAPVRLVFSRRDVRGAIFYWSTTAAGIRRSTVSDLPPDDYLVKGQAVSGTEVNCAACHTLSRDGQRLGAYVNGNLWVTQVTPAAPPPPVFQGVPGAAPKRTWITFSPDNARIVMSAQGALSEREGSTGALVRAIALPAGKFGTHPDWSPDGTRVAFTLSEDADSDKVQGSDIARLPLVDGGFGAAEVLVARGSASETNAYPAFSPDGQHLAFVRSQRNTHGDETAKLWLAPGGGGAPVRLGNANFVVNNETLPETSNFQNNMPTWAPRGDLDWIAFNSKRGYGVVYQTGPQQIWIAAVDLSRLDGGVDPSYPAFRLPFQDLDENNHRPFWALDVRRDLPDGGAADGGVPDGGACLGEGMTCDQEQIQCCRQLFCAGPDADGGFACTRIR